MINTVPYSVPQNKTNAATIAGLPRSDGSDPGGTRTPNNQFRSIPSLEDLDKQTGIYGVLTPNRTNVRVHQSTSADVHTVPNTVPKIITRIIKASRTAPPWNRSAWSKFITRLREKGVR